MARFLSLSYAPIRSVIKFSHFIPLIYFSSNAGAERRFELGDRLQGFVSIIFLHKKLKIFALCKTKIRDKRDMANQGAKKRKEENARHMEKLRRLIIACNVIYIVVRMLIYHSSFTWKQLMGLALTSVAYVIPYHQLASMAKPTYAYDGDLLDGGFDMSTGGICGYMHDIIYITSFVQIMSILSEKFWYTYLVIPAYGAYQSFGFIKGFLPQGSEGVMEDEKTRKKREKMERKASRGKFVKTRTR